MIGRTYLCTNTAKVASAGSRSSGRAASAKARPGSGRPQWRLVNDGGPIKAAAAAGSAKDGAVALWSKWARVCAVTSASEPLSARELGKATPGYFGDSFVCRDVPRRVYVRIRGVYRSQPGAFRPDAKTGYLPGVVSEAAGAVRLESGRPLLLGTVDGSGKAEVFRARTCGRPRPARFAQPQPAATQSFVRPAESSVP